MTTSRLLVEFFRPDGSPLLLADLGLEFIEENRVPLANAQRQFRVEIEGRPSKAGNTFFSYEHAGVAFPDGLDTSVRIEGVQVEMGLERPSKAGNPTREGHAALTIAGILYDAKVYLTKGSKPYWVKVHVQKASKPRVGGDKPTIVGGRIV